MNSMYQWYQRSTVCYACLSSVHLWKYGENELFHDSSSTLWASTIENEIENSKWWTRGWTLQELLAPEEMKFFAAGRPLWQFIGSISSLLRLIPRRTRISESVLRGLGVEKCSVAMRMSWASDRETTRIEDLAYCLLGVFGVNMS